MIFCILFLFLGLVACATPTPAPPEPTAWIITRVVTAVPSDTPTIPPQPTATLTATATATPFITPPPGGRPAVIPILMYHHITELAATVTPQVGDWTVTPGNLDAQMGWLVEHGFHTVTLADVAAFFTRGFPLPQKPIVVTFDDGWGDDYSTAFPILKKHNLIGTFFIYTNVVDHKLFLSWGQIGEMSRAGMEIGSHTLSHPHLKDLAPEAVQKEIVDSKALLEKRLGTRVTAFAYPYGEYNAAVVDEVKRAGFETAVTISGGYNQRADQMLLLHRIRMSYKDTLQDLATRLP